MVTGTEMGFRRWAGLAAIPEEQDTIAEILSAAVHCTALITDCHHQLKPPKNFHSGFDEWSLFRGQEVDPYISGPGVIPEDIAGHMVESPAENLGLAEFSWNHLWNSLHRKTVAGYSEARVFGGAERWV